MRLVRALARVLVLILILAIGAGVAAVAVSQTSWFRNWLRGFIVAQSSQFLNGQLAIGRLDGNLFYGLELGDVTVTMDGQPVISLQDVVLRYNAWQLLTSGLSIDELRISRPAITLRADESGWQIARMIKSQAAEADREGPASPLDIQRIVIADGHVDFDVHGQPATVPQRIDSFGAVGSFSYAPVRYSLTLDSLSLQAVAPDLRILQLGGGVAVKDDGLFLDKVLLKTDNTQVSVSGDVAHYLSHPELNLQIAAPQLSIPEIGRFVPALGNIPLQPSLDAKVSGPLDALKVDLLTKSAAGEVKAILKADLQEPGQSVSGDLSVRHLDLAPLLNDASQRSDITGDAKVDLSGDTLTNLEALSGSVSANARAVAAGYTIDRLDLHTALAAGHPAKVNARAFGYGAEASADGFVSLPAGKKPIRFDLRGRASRLNLRSLPKSLGAPPAVTNLNASYHVVGTQPMDAQSRTQLSADLVFSPSTAPGVTVNDGSTVHLSMNGRQIGYAVDATVADVDLQAIGRAFNLGALTDQKYASDIDAHLVAEGQGTDPKTLDVNATGAITSAGIMGGQLTDVMFSAGLHGDRATVEADGTFAGFDPAVISGKPQAAGQVGGEFSLQASVDQVSTGVTPDNISGDARATLQPSTVGGLAIERASVDAAMQHQLLTVRDLDVVGRDINASASGTLAFAESGDSNLTVHLDSPRLAELGKLADVPIEGIGRVDATVTGNRRLLTATGTLEGDGVKYGDNGALTLHSQFSVDVPDFTMDAARATADSRATFVTIGGQNINEVSAQTRYEAKQVTFDATAAQPNRQVAAAGQLTIHPDHQEVHLNRLRLQSANQQWAMAEDAEPAIRYGNKVIAVEGLRLVSGEQEISADGSFGAPDQKLQIALRNIDLAGLDALLLRQPQFSGRLGATASISGTTDAPAVSADFEVTGGGFRQFAYESFKGHADYDANGVGVDARLQQNAAQWITAKGHVPTALFRPAKDNDTAHAGPISDADRVDLTIDSSPLGLGLIQGFTTQVQDVAGTVEAHVRVTGTAADPLPEGAVTIADGRATVVPTGVTYTNIAGRIDLQPDRIHIGQLTVLDNHQSALSITGDLAVHEREVGGVRVWINAEDFKIIDNKIGNVRIQTAMEIAGELRAPVIQGDFSIDTGRINLDELIALAGPSPYSTAPVDFTSGGTTAAPVDVTSAGTGAGTPTATDNGAAATSATAASDAPQPPPSPSVFDALRMNLRVQVPDDFVVKASNLQAPGGSVGLGALNVTLGGDLVAAKEVGGPLHLSGQVNTIRGTYDFQGRRFDILRDGSIRFDGGDITQPVLDIRTRREIQGVEALVTVRGRLDRPEIVLSSTPPLEEADILSLIVFNQPINQLGEGQQASLTARAQSLAIGAVAGQISQSIGAALNLDTFEINLGPENGAAAEVTLGQQLGKDLYLRVQQGVGETSTTNVIVEYAFSAWLRLQTNFLQGNSSTAQSLFRRQQGSGADLIVLFTK